MANKKIEKALYGPSTIEVALGAVLGLLLGVLVAAVFLVFKPVQTVKEKPKEPVKGVVYHWTGRTDPNRARSWQEKFATFERGGTVMVSEDELNAWAVSISGAAPAKPTAKPAAAPAKPGEKPKTDDKNAPAAAVPANSDFVTASGLNFRIEDGRLHVASHVTLNYYGISKEVMLQATGGFQRTGDTFAFKPDEVYLGSCPVHALPGITGALAKALVAKAKVSDEFRAAWMKITELSVEGDLVKVTTTP